MGGSTEEVQLRNQHLDEGEKGNIQADPDEDNVKGKRKRDATRELGGGLEMEGWELEPIAGPAAVELLLGPVATIWVLPSPPSSSPLWFLSGLELGQSFQHHRGPGGQGNFQGDVEFFH